MAETFSLILIAAKSSLRPLLTPLSVEVTDLAADALVLLLLPTVVPELPQKSLSDTSDFCLAAALDSCRIALYFD